MPPVGVVTCAPLSASAMVTNNGTTAGPLGTQQTDLQALLYIVITLLFYSLGIIIGIISYLKREKREMQEDRSYDEYLRMKLDPFLAVKSQRVQQFTERIKFLEERKRLREEEAERLRALALSEAANAADDHNLRRLSRISLLPPDMFSMQFLHKGCQTDDMEKESNTLGSKARKIVKILTPTPTRNPRTSKIHFPRTSKKKVKYKDNYKDEQTLSSPTLLDDDQLSFACMDIARQRSPSILVTPPICLPPDDMTSRSTLSESPTGSRRERSPVPYIDASTDDDVATVDRATTPLIHESTSM